MGQIQGKVARILNTRELVFNRGTSHGVELGMRFLVLDSGAEDIIDPDTGEVIGSLQKPKVEVEVTQVGESIAVGRTYKYTRKNVGGTAAPFTSAGQIARLFAPPQYVREYETLKSEDNEWQPLSEEESYVKVGDPIVELTIDEEDSDAIPGGVIATDQTAVESTAGESSAESPEE